MPTKEKWKEIIGEDVTESNKHASIFRQLLFIKINQFPFQISS